MRIKRKFPETITHKIFETNSDFIFSTFFLLLLTKLSFQQGDWTLGYHSMKFRHFTDISLFPKIVSLKSFDKSLGNLYIPCL